MKCAEWLGCSRENPEKEGRGSGFRERGGLAGVDCESQTAVAGHNRGSIIAPFSQVAVLLCGQQRRLLLWGGVQQAQQ